MYSHNRLNYLSVYYTIPEQQVFKAYKLVKANAGSHGIDQQSLTDFEDCLKGNLYKIWNRLSSGSYFPQPVMAVEIPKKSGGVRVLGIPTVNDRIAQMVIKLSLEPKVEPHFLEDSYGYRPNKSALDAIGVTRKRCWKYDRVLEFDIKGLFDNIPHNLLMKAVEKHTQDKWMQINYSGTLWCRYADDGLVHCKTENQAMLILDCLTKRFNNCDLEIHPDKTKIVYCRDSRRKYNHKLNSFDFLGYTFRPRKAKSNEGVIFTSFSPTVSKASMKSMRDRLRKWKLKYRVEYNIEQIAKIVNPILRGWYQYYGRYSQSSLRPFWTYFNLLVSKWVIRKYKKIRGRRVAFKYLQKILKNNRNLFEHWKLGCGTNFA